jgi:hypothetical protein
LRVPNIDDVFAIGDAALTPDELTVVALRRQVPYLVKLIWQLIAGKEAQMRPPYRAWSAPPLWWLWARTTHGATPLPGRLVAGRFTTAPLKSRHLRVVGPAQSWGAGNWYCSNER